MSKFCTNCGAQADDAAFVCGNCGTPFGAADVAEDGASVKRAGGIKKFIKPAIALVVAAVIVVSGIIAISNFTGAKGAARKYYSAMKKSKASAVAKVLSIRYGEDEEDREEAAERMVGDDDDDEQDEYKISYKIKEAKKVSSSELKAIKKYIKNNTDEDSDYIKAAKKVKITVTYKEKKTGDGGRNTSWVVFTKEKGKWKYFGSYYEVEYLAKNKSSGIFTPEEYYDDDEEDYDPFDDDDEDYDDDDEDYDPFDDDEEDYDYYDDDEDYGDYYDW